MTEHIQELGYGKFRQRYDDATKEYSLEWYDSAAAAWKLVMRYDGSTQKITRLIATDEINDLAITTPKLADLAITIPKIDPAEFNVANKLVKLDETANIPLEHLKNAIVQRLLFAEGKTWTIPANYHVQYVLGPGQSVSGSDTIQGDGSLILFEL